MFASPSVCILCACRLRSEAAAVLGMRALNWLMESCHGPFTGLIRHFCGRVRVRVGGRLASCRSTACSRSQNQTTHPLQSCRGGLMKCPTLWVKSQSCCGCFHYLYLAFPITNIFELICHIVSLKDCFLSTGWNMTCFGRICIMLLCKFLSSSLIFPNTTLRFSFDKKTLLIYRRVTSPLWALGACSGSKTSSCRLCWSGRVTETSQVNSPQNGGINPPPFVVLSECLLQWPETPRRVKRIRGVTFLPRGLDIGLRFPLLQSALS